MTLLDVFNRLNPDNVIGVTYKVRWFHHKNKNVMGGITLRFNGFNLELIFQKLIYANFEWVGFDQDALYKGSEDTLKLIVTTPIASIEYKVDAPFRRSFFSNTIPNWNNISFGIGLIEKKKLKKTIRKNQYKFQRYSSLSLSDHVIGNLDIFQNYLQRKEMFNGN
jgi:hypothetical protein